jgi:aldehyde dehydrogenase (NAD+)
VDYEKILTTLGLDPQECEGGNLKVSSPIDGHVFARLKEHTPLDVTHMIENARKSFETWRLVPAPQRGELLRLYGQELRAHKQQLATLITLENGKILQESLGEVQEMIDMCDFAVGLSRQLYGLTMASERPFHRMMETWHPLGPIGIISPFNFPLAVWCWNFALALVCGDPGLWKPSSLTPVTALAALKLFERAVGRFKGAPPHLLQVMVGGQELGKALVDSPHLPLISATGGTAMGRAVATRVAARFGRTILELSGNNGMILTPSADFDLAIRAIVFSALGTTGQRCTTLRRLFVHKSLYEKVITRLQAIYARAPVGNPLEPKTLMGPLIHQESYEQMQQALEKARSQAGKIWGGERILQDIYSDAYYVRPALVQMPEQSEIVVQETFAPILYVMAYEDFETVLKVHNDVPQGLSSCIFTNDVREAEIFLSSRGSDCGIANVNIGPSGAEIGGAFGGEKETGGGRESGSDAWKSYMRRATNTINFSKELPLAQGIHFDVGEI